MNLKFLLLLFPFIHLVSSAFEANSALSYAIRQYTILSQRLAAEGPQSGFITTGNPLNLSWDKTDVNRWTVGFYGGSLWTLYKLTGDNYWRTLAEEYQTRVEVRQYDTSTHDVGFVIMSTYGLCLELTGNASLTVPVIEQAAASLSSRFHCNC